VLQQLRGAPRVDGISLEAVDFSGARLPGLIVSRSHLRDVRFDRAGLKGAVLGDSALDACSFRGAELAGGQINSGAPGWFRHCDFSGARLDGVYSGSASFEDCDFSNVRLRKAEFGGCRLVRCRFSGDLDEVIFTDADMVVRGPKPSVTD